MDFTFLFDDTRKLFSIGYRVGGRKLWIRIAMTCLPPRRAWQVLSPSPKAKLRHLTGFIWAARSRLWIADSALISWSGSMFEYLMPALVMRSPEEAC